MNLIPVPVRGKVGGVTEPESSTVGADEPGRDVIEVRLFAKMAEILHQFERPDHSVGFEKVGVEVAAGGAAVGDAHQIFL